MIKLSRMIIAFWVLVLGFSVLPYSAVQAVQPDELLKDPKLEARARAISAKLRCLVCQNQSIDDSDADLARDLRVLVRERLKAGDTNSEVFTYLTDRYGDFILLEPPLKMKTLLLWLAPAFALGFGVFLLFRMFRSGAGDVAALAGEGDKVKPLTDEEKEKLKQLMDS